MRMLVATLALIVLSAGCGTAQDAIGSGVDDLRARADDLLADGRELSATFDWCTGAAQLAQAVVEGDVERAREEADALRGDAPEDLGADLRTIAEAAARSQVGDPRQLMDDDVQDAARDVYAYAVDLCGLRGGG